MHPLQQLRRKQAKRYSRREMRRMRETATTWFLATLLTIAAVPCAVLFGLALAESARLIG